MPVLFIAGVVTLLLGLILLVVWFSHFVAIIKVILPILFMGGGAIAAYLGWEELKDRKDPRFDFSSQDEAERYKAEATAYQAGLEGMKGDAAATVVATAAVVTAVAAEKTGPETPAVIHLPPNSEAASSGSPNAECSCGEATTDEACCGDAPSGDSSNAECSCGEAAADEACCGDAPNSGSPNADECSCGEAAADKVCCEELPSDGSSSEKTESPTEEPSSGSESNFEKPTKPRGLKFL